MSEIRGARSRSWMWLLRVGDGEVEVKFERGLRVVLWLLLAGNALVLSRNRAEESRNTGRAEKSADLRG